MHTFMATRTDFIVNVCSIRREQLQTLENKALGMVKDKIQRLSIRGSKECTLDADAKTATKTERKHAKVVATSSLEEQILPQRREDCKAAQQLIATEEPIYAVIDLKNKYAQRQMRSAKFELKRYNSYDSIVNKGNNNATADELRQQRNAKTISLAEDDIEGIYEDGDAFCRTAEENADLVTQDDEEENIYEPINVPGTHAPNAFWKYFTRLKVSRPLLQLARMRKRNADYDSIKLPNGNSATHASHFTSIKHKFGTHRKSMQVRMRKFCCRAYEPKPIFKQQQQQQSSSNSDAAATAALNNNNIASKQKSTTATKYHWKSVKLRPNKAILNAGVVADSSKAEKQRFFGGSLPHLRRARLSLFNTQRLQQLNVASECAAATATTANAQK